MDRFDKHKIYFLDDKLSTKHDNLPTTVTLVKEDPRYYNIILQYTHITSVLIDIIVGYTHELLLIETKNISNDSIVITLQDNFSVTIETSIGCAMIMFNDIISKILSQTYKIVDEKDTRLYEYARHTNKYINIFINYYMKHHYGYDKYITHTSSIIHLLDIEQSNSFMDNNIFNQYVYESQARCYHKIVTVYDHEKVTHMIMIIKLFIDLLTKKN